MVKKKAPMGYIYEAMNRAKDASVRSFNGNEEKYKEIFNIKIGRASCRERV